MRKKSLIRPEERNDAYSSTGEYNEDFNNDWQPIINKIQEDLLNILKKENDNQPEKNS